MEGGSLKWRQPGTVRGATARVTSILAIPYGYTVTLWSAGALAVARLGPPGVPEVLLFVLGACAAFVALAIVGSPHLDAEVPMRVSAVVVLNLFPIVPAVLVAGLPLSLLGRAAGYGAASLLATGAYVLSLALLLRVRARWAGGPAA
ncbi:MAG: hypothetical protein ACE147_11400 [Candidatus Methylomirabilales bacterium]